MFLRLAEKGIHEGNSKFFLERNPAPDLRLGPVSKLFPARTCLDSEGHGGEG